TLALITRAAENGADLIATPEVTNLVTTSRAHQAQVLCAEDHDPTLHAIRDLAAKLGRWVLVGSLALRGEMDARFVNRSLLIDDVGAVRARADKIHMFNVSLPGGERYEESAGYRPGDRAVLATTPWGKLGMTVCYDLRFAPLFRSLAQAGATLLSVPSAFTVPTGAAHWEVLLRARAIECGAFVLAPAQTGTHRATIGRARQTYGHSLAIDPWGRVLADAGTAPGVTCVALDLDQTALRRAQIPSLRHDRAYGTGSDRQ
ncbi:MAG: carbon-nitrogen hydrolase family protein, partial [Pseudomonadota bacterium]